MATGEEQKVWPRAPADTGAQVTAKSPAWTHLHPTAPGQPAPGTEPSSPRTRRTHSQRGGPLRGRGEGPCQGPGRRPHPAGPAVCSLCFLPGFVLNTTRGGRPQFPLVALSCPDNFLRAVLYVARGQDSIRVTLEVKIGERDKVGKVPPFF